MSDPFAAKRREMREEFFAKLFLLGGWLGGTDTYKRTMWAAVPDIALGRAGYSLTFRKGLPEPGANNRLIMAGHEAMLAQWFHRPLQARATSSCHGAGTPSTPPTKAFPARSCGTRSSPRSPATTSRCRWTSGASPAGRRSSPGVPCLSFEGPGGLDLLPRTGDVPLLRPGHPGDQGPADEAGHAARRRVRPALRPGRGVQPRSCCWPATSAGGRRRSSRRTTPPSSSTPSCSSRSAPSATR